MTTLMIYAGEAAAESPGTRTGGVPLVPAGFEWPVCAECAAPMRFLAQIAQPDGVLAIFMCEDDPGMCESWDAASGANRALVFPAEALRPAQVPPGETVLTEVSGVELAEMDGDDYDAARELWPQQNDRTRRNVLGQLGGVPGWVQGDEIPDCASCGRPMVLAAQLEEGLHADTGANYGGGSAYAFRCPADATAAFLWQQ